MNTEHYEATLASLHNQHVAVCVDFSDTMRIIFSGILYIMPLKDANENMKFGVITDETKQFYSSIIFSSKDVSQITDVNTVDKTTCKKYIYVNNLSRSGFPSFAANEH